MKSLRFNLSALLRAVRLVLVVCVCAVLVFSQALPAYSDTKAPKSDPRGGEANLLDIELKSQEAVLDKPYGLEKTQKEANKGINEIQGDADIEKMKTPENSQGAESVEQKFKEALESVTGKK